MKGFLAKIKSSKSGFTLIELMVVIAIIAILSGIALPNLIGSKSDSMLKNAARGLLGDIQKTRIGAIKDNQSWSIIFTADGYQIQDAAGDVKKTVTFTSHKSGVNYGQGSATAPIATTFGGDFNTYTGNILTFNPRGTCGNGYVYLANGKGTVFGIGTLASGIVIFKQWMGTNWSN